MTLEEKDKVAVPEPGAGSEVGLKSAVTPEGTPVKERLMSELKPPSVVMEMEDEPEFPGRNAGLSGEAFRTTKY